MPISSPVSRKLRKSRKRFSTAAWVSSLVRGRFGSFAAGTLGWTSATRISIHLWASTARQMIYLLATFDSPGHQTLLRKRTSRLRGAKRFIGSRQWKLHPTLLRDSPVTPNQSLEPTAGRGEV